MFTQEINLSSFNNGIMVQHFLIHGMITPQMLHHYIQSGDILLLRNNSDTQYNGRFDINNINLSFNNSGQDVYFAFYI